MAKDSQYRVGIFDEKDNRVVYLDERGLMGLGNKLEDVKKLIETILDKIKEPDGFKLKTFDVSLSLEGNIFVVKTTGAIKLSYVPKD